MEKIASAKTSIGLSGLNGMDMSGTMKNQEMRVPTELKQKGQDRAVSGWPL